MTLRDGFFGAVFGIGCDVGWQDCWNGRCRGLSFVLVVLRFELWKFWYSFGLDVSAGVLAV